MADRKQATAREAVPLGPQMVTRIDSRGAEMRALEQADTAFHEGEYTRLQRELELASQNSHLPERLSSKEALNELLVRVRLRGRLGQKVSD